MGSKGAARALLWVAWALILLPVSVDNLLNIPFGDYDLRVNYFGAALAGLVFLALAARADAAASPASARARLFAYLRSRQAWAFLAMTAFGVLGALGSSHPKRSWMFLVWTSGTLVGVPFLAGWLQETLGAWVARSFVLYLGAQSALIGFDALACIPSAGKFHLGRVQIYDYLGVRALCRPHAFYQEPGYFAGFALLGALFCLAWRKADPDPRWRKASAAVFAASLAAILLTTSRMGILGVAVFGAWAIGRALLGERDWSALRARILPQARVAAWGAGTAAAAAILLVALNWNALWTYALQGFASPTQDGSFRYRYLRTTMALRVFQDRPWVGAGPGGSGAYFVDHFPEALRELDITPHVQQAMRHDPLSLNLYSELLSEWGALGTLAFGIGLGFLVLGAPLGLRAVLALVLAVIFSSTQTLPRFDLWLALGMLGRRSSAMLDPERRARA